MAAKLYENFTVRMQPVAIVLNYLVENIQNNVRQIIGACLSEPHTSEFNNYTSVDAKHHGVA